MPSVLTKPLNIDDISQCMKLAQCAASRWKLIGVSLEVQLSILDNIERDEKTSKEKLCSVFGHWLKRNVIKKSIGKTATWNDLITAIAAGQGGENPALAVKIQKELEKEFLNQDEESQEQEQELEKQEQEQHQEKQLLQNSPRKKRKIRKKVKRKVKQKMHVTPFNKKETDLIQIPKEDTTEETIQESQNEDITPLQNETNTNDAPSSNDEIADISEKDITVKRTESLVLNDTAAVPYSITVVITSSIIIVRQEEFSYTCLQTVFPRINLSYRSGRQLIKRTTVKLLPSNNKIQLYDYTASNDIGIQDDVYRGEIEHLYKTCQNPDLIIFCTSMPNKLQSPKKIRENEKNAIKALSHFFETKMTNMLFFLSTERNINENNKQFDDRLRKKIEHLTKCVSQICVTAVPIKSVYLDAKKKTFDKDYIYKAMEECCTAQARPILRPSMLNEQHVTVHTKYS